MAYASRALAYSALFMDSEAEADIERAIELGFDRALLEQVIEQVKSLR